MPSDTGSEPYQPSMSSSHGRSSGLTGPRSQRGSVGGRASAASIEAERGRLSFLLPAGAAAAAQQPGGASSGALGVPVSKLASKSGSTRVRSGTYGVSWDDDGADGDAGQPPPPAGGASGARRLGAGLAGGGSERRGSITSTRVSGPRGSVLWDKSLPGGAGAGDGGGESPRALQRRSVPAAPLLSGKRAAPAPAPAAGAAGEEWYADGGGEARGGGGGVGGGSSRKRVNSVPTAAELLRVSSTDMMEDTAGPGPGSLAAGRSSGAVSGPKPMRLLSDTGGFEPSRAKSGPSRLRLASDTGAAEPSAVGEGPTSGARRGVGKIGNLTAAIAASRNFPDGLPLPLPPQQPQPPQPARSSRPQEAAEPRRASSGVQLAMPSALLQLSTDSESGGAPTPFPVDGPRPPPGARPGRADSLRLQQKSLPPVATRPEQTDGAAGAPAGGAGKRVSGDSPRRRGQPSGTAGTGSSHEGGGTPLAALSGSKLLRPLEQRGAPPASSASWSQVSASSSSDAPVDPRPGGNAPGGFAVALGKQPPFPSSSGCRLPILVPVAPAPPAAAPSGELQAGPRGLSGSSSRGQLSASMSVPHQDSFTGGLARGSKTAPRLAPIPDGAAVAAPAGGVRRSSVELGVAAHYSAAIAAAHASAVAAKAAAASSTSARAPAASGPSLRGQQLLQAAGATASAPVASRALAAASAAREQASSREQAIREFAAAQREAVAVAELQEAVFSVIEEEAPGDLLATHPISRSAAARAATAGASWDEGEEDGGEGAGGGFRQGLASYPLPISKKKQKAGLMGRFGNAFRKAAQVIIATNKTKGAGGEDGSEDGGGSSRRNGASVKGGVGKGGSVRQTTQQRGAAPPPDAPPGRPKGGRVA